MAWNPLDGLTEEQLARIHRFDALLLELNRRMNLVSRDDESQIFDRHILHCLALTWKRFPAGETVVDWGTGGGLPAIPLAIAFPETRFVAVDAVEKKVLAVRLMARRLDLKNLEARHARAEEFVGTASYSASRATARLDVLWSWHLRLNAPKAARFGDGYWRPGLVCLKGGELSEEISALQQANGRVSIRTFALEDILHNADFKDKVVLECSRVSEPRPSGRR